MTIIEYTIYLFFVLLGTIYLYRLLTTLAERKIYRLKIIKQVQEQKTKVVEKNKTSKLQEELKLTGFEFFSAMRFQVLRAAFILVTSSYYIVLPFWESRPFNINVLAIPAVLFIITEPTLKFSITSIVIRYLINRRKRRKIVEVFTLFDLLKADLNSLRNSQQVNIYSILKESLPMFEEINGTLSRLLSLWKTSPEKAKEVLFEEIGGESTKILGDIIFKLDKTSKEEAINILESESSVFSFSYYEGELQQSSKQKTVLYGFFTFTSILIISWLVLFVFSMFNDSITNNNIL